MSRILVLSVAFLTMISFSPSFAADALININEENCRRVEKHTARDDVAYKPGVDVDGKPVVPADLDENRLKVPENIIIDLSIPLEDLYKDPNQISDKIKSADVQIGIIEFNILSGKLKFNGQEIGDPALNAIAIECREVYGDGGS